MSPGKRLRTRDCEAGGVSGSVAKPTRVLFIFQTNKKNKNKTLEARRESLWLQGAVTLTVMVIGALEAPRG
jgi:hypothetical protein